MKTWLKLCLIEKLSSELKDSVKTPERVNEYRKLIAYIKTL